MNIQKINDAFSASPQLHADDIAAAAAQGFKAIVCNRPDYEGPDQTPSEAIEDAAKASGIAFHYVPAVPGKVDESHISAFADILADAEGPILAYCKTGLRSVTLWALANAPTMDADDILVAASQAGYDLALMRPKLQGMSGG